MNSGMIIRGMNWLSGLAIAPNIDTKVNRPKNPNQKTGKTRFWMNVRRDEIRFMCSAPEAVACRLSRGGIDRECTTAFCYSIVETS